MLMALYTVVISTCFCMPELRTSIDDCNLDNHEWVTVYCLFKSHNNYIMQAMHTQYAHADTCMPPIYQPAPGLSILAIYNYVKVD